MPADLTLAGKTGRRLSAYITGREPSRSPRPRKMGRGGIDQLSRHSRCFILSNCEPFFHIKVALRVQLILAYLLNSAWYVRGTFWLLGPWYFHFFGKLIVQLRHSLFGLPDDTVPLVSTQTQATH
jgi:hypothetical protein